MLGCSRIRTVWLSFKCPKSSAFLDLPGLTLMSLFGFFSDLPACFSDSFLYIWNKTLPSTDAWLVLGLPLGLGDVLGDALGEA